ncbi:MAG TPA: copper resistance protein CopC [Ktedonobacteraceae bacterium]|nr:copper resistance protein CopC [Ktedonobacteraceae bacterium]
MSILRQRMKLLFAALFSIGALLLMASTASAHSTVSTHPVIPAHAKVDKAIPAIGSTIAQAPTSVTVFTLENMNPDPTKSNLFVYSPAGDLISQGNAQVSLQNPMEMSIKITPDAKNLNGIYVVRWITVSADDGDPDQGAFVFTVAANAAASPTPIPTTSNQTTPPPSNNTSSASGGTPVWVPIVVGILALLIGLGGGLGLGRRNVAPTIGSMRRTIAQQSEEEAAKRP